MSPDDFDVVPEPVIESEAESDSDVEANVVIAPSHDGNIMVLQCSFHIMNCRVPKRVQELRDKTMYKTPGTLYNQHVTGGRF